MTTSNATPDAPETPEPESTHTFETLWTERVGARTYVGRNERGGEVRIGPQELAGAFTPGELLAIALAGCTGMSADSPIARRLGDDVAISVGATRIKDVPGNRYGQISLEIVVDAASLDEAGRAQLQNVARRAVDSQCTVGRSIEPPGVHVDLAFSDEG
ncbi:OsmC family protein [Beutenbergia cavernae DSM 12333]|uniref:OsmC family protein n=1 Tax=Beutenbergia cavernae (strain ATCC BAA-8 / DSM 12333 / CCUG 43141 / JCM 11478 / NBRC 16432 / NCIMB 13614 / HKI 0122) TaxID=471853 RepID=C5BYY5_BEUC1|nr:OsmC family protein [Beutenbergia cavernae]ACQ81100.1 OsmC family protein [Beutenbergia cavernae DSM 12333]